MLKFKSKNRKRFICETNNRGVLFCVEEINESSNNSNNTRSVIEEYRKRKNLTQSSIPRNLVKATNPGEYDFIYLLNKEQYWQSVLYDKFDCRELNQKYWNISLDDSTGGSNLALQAYNDNATKNIKIKNGKLNLIARPQWYVQPIGCKDVCVTYGDYNPARCARPYTSGAINTHGKINIDWSTPGYIEVKFKSQGGVGTWPTIWLYGLPGPTANGVYGPWSASGELDIMEIWHGPIDGYFYNIPQHTIWFGGGNGNNALLYAAPTLPEDPYGTHWHTVQFSWDSLGLFVWKLDGIVNFILGPSQYEVRMISDISSPLVVNPYGNYLSFGNSVIANQPYQGVYVGYDNGGSMVITNSSPSPFDYTNPFFLMIELQVGGDSFFDIAPENDNVFNAGNSVNLSNTPDGLISDQQAQILGLPSRPAAFFTEKQKFKIQYVKYVKLK